MNETGTATCAVPMATAPSLLVPLLSTRLLSTRLLRALLSALLLCALLCTFAARDALAAMKGSTEVGLFGGYMLTGYDTELGDAWYPDNVPGRCVAIGARGSYALSREFAAELELRYGAASFKRDGSPAHLLSVRGQVLAHLGLLDQTLRPFVLVGLGSEAIVNAKDAPPGDPRDKTERDADAALYIGAGLEWTVAGGLVVRSGFRQITVAGRDNPWDSSFELLLGASVLRGATPPDRDRDGILDPDDQCPGRAEDHDGFQDTDGCPDPDNDGDGILDPDDKCPNRAETRNGLLDRDGCPDKDTDNDGIADTEDKCPIRAEDRDGFQDEDGCPDDDDDGDGVPDARDLCKLEPEDKDGYQDGDGCPERDNDLDGVPDTKDKCPNGKETFNGFRDEDGCPDKVPRKVARAFRGRVEGVLFETGTAKLKPRSFKVLRRALDLLRKYPGVRFLVAGHTDDAGRPEANMKLSRDRAAAVRAWFIEQGIDPGRIRAEGLGGTRPIAGNDRSQGRAKNRRIEFVLDGSRPAGRGGAARR